MLITSEHKFEPPDRVSEESLVNRPSPGALNSSGQHPPPTASAHTLRSTEVIDDRLEFPDGAVVRVRDSPSDPDHALLVMGFIVPPGAMPTDAHVHPRQAETYAVQEGSVEVLTSREWSVLEAGGASRSSNVRSRHSYDADHPDWRSLRFTSKSRVSEGGLLG